MTAGPGTPTEAEGEEVTRRPRSIGATAWLVAFALLAVFPYFSRLNNPNENARIWLVKAVVDFHELSLDRVCAEWGYVNDRTLFAGRLYSAKAPGASLVGVPIYFVQKTLAKWLGRGPVTPRGLTWALRVFAVAAPMAAFALFFSRYVARLTGSAAARDVLTVGLGLGTMMYPYGVLFVGHAVAAALAFVAYTLLAQEAPLLREDRARAPASRLALAGALAGFAVVFEYQVTFAAALLTAYAAFRHRRGVGMFLLGALVPAAILGAYHTALFGRPWDFPLAHLEDPSWAKTFNDARAYGLDPPSARVALTILFSPSIGLFCFSPFLFIGLLGAIRDVSPASGPAGRPDAALTLGIFGAMTCFLAAVPNWHSGWCVGPRYIVVVTPFLAAAAARAWPALRARPWRLAVTVGLVMTSVVLNAVSGALYPHYPEAFDNPVFDLAWPLVRDGFAPYGLGAWLGLPGRWSLLPVAAAVVAAIGLSLSSVWAEAAVRPGPRGPRLVAVAGALAVATTFLGALSFYGRSPRPPEDHATAIVRQLWEPAPAPSSSVRPAAPAR